MQMVNIPRHLFLILPLVFALAVIRSVAVAEPAATQPVERIAIGDKLSISVDDLVGVGVVSVMKPVVDKNGEIKLIMLDKVTVDGLTVDEAQIKISEAYRDQKTITNAQIHLSWVSHAD